MALVSHKAPLRWGRHGSGGRFDGTSDYLSITSITGLDDTQTFTIACRVRCDSPLNVSVGHAIFQINLNKILLTLFENSGNPYWLCQCEDNAAADIKWVRSDTESVRGSPWTDEWINILISFNTAATGSASRLMYFDDDLQNNIGTDLTGTIELTDLAAFIGAQAAGANKFPGDIQFFWFDDSYIDLSVEANRRKFFDAEGRRQFLGADGSKPTGSQPLVYLDNDAGKFEKNRGSGGDFSVTGSLGNVVFQPGGRFDGSNGFLARGAQYTGLSDGQKGTLAMKMRINAGLGSNMDFIRPNAGRFLIRLGTDNKLRIFGQNSTNISIDTRTTNTLSADTWYNVLLSWDVENDSNAQMYMNDTDDVAAPATFDSAQLIDYTDTDWGIGAGPTGTNYVNGDIVFLWFTDSKIDFSVEANRRLFFDATGNVADLGEDGSTPTGTAPIVFVGYGRKGNDMAANLGSGGGHIINGDIGLIPSG